MTSDAAPKALHEWTLKSQSSPMTSSFEPQADYECGHCGLVVTVSSGVVHHGKGQERVALYWRDWEAKYGNSPYAELIGER